MGLPSLLGHAGEHGLTRKAYTGRSGCPVAFHTRLNGSPNIVPVDRTTGAAASTTSTPYCAGTAPRSTSAMIQRPRPRRFASYIAASAARSASRSRVGSPSP